MVWFIICYIYIYIPLKKRPPPLLKQEPNSLANMARMCFTRHWDMYIYSTSRIILYIILSQSGVILGRSDPWKKVPSCPPPYRAPPFWMCVDVIVECAPVMTPISVFNTLPQWSLGPPTISRSADVLISGRPTVSYQTMWNIYNCK